MWQKFVMKKDFYIYKETTLNVIKNHLEYNVIVDKSARLFNFAINSDEKLYLIEANYYGGVVQSLRLLLWNTTHFFM